MPREPAATVVDLDARARNQGNGQRPSTVGRTELREVPGRDGAPDTLPEMRVLASFDEARELARSSGRPIVALIIADWSSRSRAFEAAHWERSPSLRRRADVVVFVRIDATTSSPEVERAIGTLGVRGIPAIVVFDPKSDGSVAIEADPPEAAVIEAVDALRRKR